MRTARLRIHLPETFCRYVNDNPFGEVVYGQIHLSAAYVRGTARVVGDVLVYIDLGPSLSARIPPGEDDRGIPGLILTMTEPRGDKFDRFDGVEAFCLLLGRSGGQEDGHVRLTAEGVVAEAQSDQALVVREHPQQRGKYLRLAVTETRFDLVQDTDGNAVYSMSDLEALFHNAEVQEFILV